MGIFSKWKARRKARRGLKRLPTTTETFDAKKFIASGGTQVATTPSKAQTMVSRTFGGGAGARAPTPTPTAPEPTPEPEPTPTAITEYEEPTAEEVRETRYLTEMRGREPGVISRGIGRFTAGIGGVVSKLVGKKPTPEEELLTYVPEPTYIIGGTPTYRPPKEDELTPEAGFLASAIGEEIGAGVAVQVKLERERERLLEEISPGGITEEEARKANIQLEKYRKEVIKEYEKEYKTREEIRREKFFPTKGLGKILPEWEFEPKKVERELWEAGQAVGIKPWEVKTGVAGISFVHGLYTGIREEPIKTALTAGAFAVLPVGFKVAGKVSKALGVTEAISAYPTTTALVGKGVRYGIGGVYGASVAGRLALAPDIYARAGVAGEIFSTELLPMAVGWKMGAYGVRRYEARAELKEMATELSARERVLFEKQMAEATAFAKVKPEVKEISLREVEYIPRKAEEPIMKFLRAKRRELVVGGRVAEYAQIYPKPEQLAHDIDIYLRGARARVGARIYTQELAQQLRMAGVERVSIPKGKSEITIAGKKAIEIHPYKEYLRYNIEQVLPWYKPAKMAITTTPSGIKVLELPVQWKRMIVRGYFEKGEALARARVIRKSMIESARIKTVGREIYEVPYIEKGVMGETIILMGKPIRIKILKGLPPRAKAMVREHELIHAARPWWSEAKVRRIIGLEEIQAGRPWLIKRTPIKEEIFEKWLGKKRMRIERGEGVSIKPTKVSEYPYYKPKLDVAFYPGYKPTKGIDFGIPYERKKPKEITPFIPTIEYKPKKIIPTRFFLRPYKPKPPIEPTAFPFFYEEIIPTKKKKVVRPGRLPGVEDPFKSLIAKRKFKRTVSLGAILQKELTGYAPKMQTQMREQTGLIERSFEGAMPKKVQLPVTMLRSVKRKYSKNKYKRKKK